ncbi:hypothetical protein C1645_812103 [Glomus cerebriforme]|uniref:F-box domain-containing protein n=1 Tax=Glomus cerebriforme TaxID=658196 RepID=A0A397TLV0_9GLOM|nr:hypothetical protein C1645_812103 [Glomus cerebriforme]
MSYYLTQDCLIMIFNELRDDLSSLYSCILVNRFWCRIAMPILWKTPFEINPFEFDNGKSPLHYKLYNVMISLLPTSSKQLLLKNNIEITYHKFSDQPFFNYISFISQISSVFIKNMTQNLINEEIDKFNKFQREYKQNLLEQEFYKLFIKNCKDIKYFYWQTLQPISQYEGALNCFSKLHTLSIEFQIVTTTALFGMAQICQNIEELNIFECYGDNSGLINFIDIQKNLKSLSLSFKDSKNQSIQLSEVIERKASTLKKLIIEPYIISILPKFLPSLINLQCLELNNYGGIDEMDIFREEKWNEYLTKSSFPNLQNLKTSFLPYPRECDLIERSNGNILEIEMFRSIYNQDSSYTEKLIKTIAKNCPKINKLTIDAELENLNGIKEIFLNCRQLKKINLSIRNDEELNCDELLKILIDYSPKSLYEFSFCENLIFTIEGLNNFFENWRGRKPLVFNKYSYRIGYFTNDHRMIVKKYLEEGVIKKTNPKFLYLV